MSKGYDVIVVGARCAGSPTAMLLARKGHRVLLVDRATFPSDTISTLVIQPLGVAALSRWGLLDRLVASGCPALHTYAFDFGPFVLEGRPGTADSPVAYAPRRTVLDALLVEAAAQGGAEVREGFVVDRITVEDGRVVGVEGRSKDGARVAERARVVVGADGRSSDVAAAVRAESYREKPPLLAPYYAFWSGLPMEGRFETYIRPRRGFAAIPTNDGLTLVVVGWPIAEFAANRADVEGNYHRTIDLVPAFAGRLRRAKRESRFAGFPVANYFRKPYGPGWALVGDAGYEKDSITAQGIVDAFLDAERTSEALGAALSGARPFEEAMAAAQRLRDERCGPMYDFTCMLAALEPPPEDLRRLLGAVHADRRSTERFVQVNAGTISPAEFFSPPSVEAIFAAAAAAG